MAASTDGAVSKLLEKPLLEEGAEFYDRTVNQSVVPAAARTLRVIAKFIAKACGVAIAWSWSDAIHSSFSEHMVPVWLTAFSAVLYAILITGFTTFMVKYIAEGAGDPNNIEYGRFGMHSRELLLLVQPMMLAWAWKDALRDAFWDRLPQDTFVALVFGRLVFALLATAVLSWLTHQLAMKIEELRERGEDKAYATVALTLLSASFSLFLAWCWNSVAKTVGRACSTGHAATAVTTTIYAVGVTALAAYITTEVSSKLREIASSVGPEAARPFWFKFIDLVSVALGYIVGWAWSDAAVNLLLETLAFSDMKMLYLVYSIVVTVVSAAFTVYMAKTVDDPDTSVLLRQYLTLFLNALALMTGWAWKSYIQHFVEQMPAGDGGRIASNYLQAVSITLVSCYVYHQISTRAKGVMMGAEERVIETAGNQMD